MTAMDLIKRLKKVSTIEDSSVLSKSRFFTEKDLIPTKVPMMNVALSASLTGGLSPGLSLICGNSRNFKTGFSLLLAKSYMDKYPNSIVIFYDSEFGTPQPYFVSFGIDMDRVLHTPIDDIEKLKHDLVTQLDNLSPEDKVIIIIDSIGNLASKKEMDDAAEGKTVEDMTRAKKLKSLFRIVTPKLMIKNVPMVAVNHIYMEQGLYPKAIVSGGSGPFLSADTIFIIGRQQEKEGKDVIGYNFVLNIEKSRYVKEKSRIIMNVTYENGISPWSGLMENALEANLVIKPNQGWYQKADPETGEILPDKYRLKDTDNKEFWFPILTSKVFQDFIKNKYSVSGGNVLEKAEAEEFFNNIEE